MRWPTPWALFEPASYSDKRRLVQPQSERTLPARGFLRRVS